MQDKRLVPGGGATEIELAKQITSYGEVPRLWCIIRDTLGSHSASFLILQASASVFLQSCPGLEQYSIKKFADAFEALPRALAENSGVKGNELISKLYAAHHEGNKNTGFDIEVCKCVLYFEIIDKVA